MFYLSSQGLGEFMVTDNGNFILANGVLIIVEDDLESYLNGTLVFHPANNLGS